MALERRSSEKGGLGVPLRRDVAAYVLPDDIIIKKPAWFNGEEKEGANGPEVATGCSSVSTSFANWVQSSVVFFVFICMRRLGRRFGVLWRYDA
jgi:hypothetical protein